MNLGLQYFASVSYGYLAEKPGLNK